MARLTPLPVPVPTTLEELLGYDGDATWLAVYVDAATAEVRGDDGHVPFALAADAYQAYITHRAVAPHVAAYDLGAPDRPGRYRLVLDRLTRTFCVALTRAARAHVRAQWPEPPRPPTSGEIGALLAQWTWRLRAEETPAGQAKRATAQAARPGELQALRAWLDAQGPHPLVLPRVATRAVHRVATRPHGSSQETQEGEDL